MLQVEPGKQYLFSVGQPVLVEPGIVAEYATIIECDVLRNDYGTRDGIAWITGRRAKVSQRFPGYDPSFEWVFLGWDDTI